MKNHSNPAVLFYQNVCVLLISIFFMTSSIGAELQIKNISRLSSKIDETSGLASHGNFIYTINDSGNSNLLHKLSRDGNILGSILISNADNTDWESLAQDDDFLYIADTGNNFNLRRTFTIYKISWTQLENFEAEAELITFSYGDYIPGNMRTHNFDAEAITIRGDEIWLFSKNRGDGNSKLYRFPKTSGSYQPMPVQSLPVNSLVTGADINPITGDLLLTSTRRQGSRWESFLWMAPTSIDGVEWDKNQKAAIFPSDQWEAVIWNEESGGMILTHENNVQGYAGMGELSINDLKN